MKTVLIVAMFAMSSGQLPPSQPLQNPNFVGEWKNVKPATEPAGFVPMIKVIDDKGDLKIQAWGVCVPQNCEWSPVRFWQLRDVAGKDSDRGFAVFPDGKHLAMRLDGSELLVELFQTSDVKINATRTRTQFLVMRFVRSSPSVIPAQSKVSVCGLLPKAEVKKLLGANDAFDRVEPQEAPNKTGSSCRYADLLVMVYEGNLDAVRKKAQSFEALSGVGQEAYLDDKPGGFDLYASVGSRQLILSRRVDSGSTTAAARAGVIALAKALAAKLQ